MTKKRFMLFIHYLVGASLLCNLAVTISFVAFDVLSVHFKLLLIISIVFYLWNLISYYKLHSDSVPVVTLLLPHIIHIAAEYFILHSVDWKAILTLIGLDILFIIIKSYKASAFPYTREIREERKVLWYRKSLTINT